MRKSLKRLSKACFVAVIVFAIPAFAQSQASTPAAPEPVATLHFDLYNNRVYLPVEVEGHSFPMILDSGAAIAGVSQATAQILHLPAKGKAEIRGNGESLLPITLTKGVTFRLGAAEIAEDKVAIMPFQDLEAREGRPVEGVLSVNVFRRYVVVTDYANRTLALYQPATFVYHGAGKVVALHLSLFSGEVTIPGHDPLPVILSVDYGTYSALRLYRGFVQKHHLLEGLSPGIDSFGFGIGGEFPERLGRAASLQIGGVTINGPVTSFSTAKGGVTASSQGADGTIGGGILSRFKVVLDYSRDQMILEPEANLAEPFPADASGLILQAGGPGLKNIAIRHVLTGTPAEAAGLHEGDIIVSVNDRDASELGLEAIRVLFYHPEVFRLTLKRGQETLVMQMTGRQLY